MMGVAQDADGTGLHHHGKFKIHWILQPPLYEGAEYVAMRNLSRNPLLAT
jgi:hypothetical protein